MRPEKILQSTLNPGVVFLTTPRVFSVCGNGFRESGKITVFSSSSNRVDRYLVDFPAFEPVVKTVSYFESVPVSGSPAETCFAVVSIAAKSINTPPVNHAAAAWKFCSLKVWGRNFEPDLELTGDDMLRMNCVITVCGMLNAVSLGRFRCSFQEIRPVRSPEKALPTGRTICLRHQQLNL